MKNILCVGCSWTFGHNLKSHQTYPAKLQDKLFDYKVINAGLGGRDNWYSCFSVMRLLREMHLDAVIFQLTTLDRLTLGNDGYENFINDSFFDTSKKFLYNMDDTYSRLGSIDHQLHLYLTSGKYLKSRDRTVKYLTEKTVRSNYSADSLAMQLFLLKEFLQKKKIPLMFFSWVPLNEDFFETSYGSYVFNDENFISTSVKNFLHDSKHDFYIDNGFHISENGNSFLVDNYIFPYLKRLINL